MSEAIIGGLIGGPLGAVIALLGNYFVIRDTRWGREGAEERKAAVTLLGHLRRMRAEGRSLAGWYEQEQFSEDCMTSVFAFRDRRVRMRLTASVQLITRAAMARHAHGDEARLAVTHLAAYDIRECLEARLDRKRLPKPDNEWTQANNDLHAFMARAQADTEEALLALEVEQEAADPPDVQFGGAS
ncbi:hypothetical protein PV336_30390 [Streptomyces sp. MI02-2A]|uniref:hypothetical protein n=1 Tax=Streptomyces sp. MI02-2A TaxID=3028688 RepID=UPI0029B45E2E|nr:hypothetical protein [Streptomyces sp. MI02-2A]MDX3263469.1 hypothetical protein [Streptomyces sp. MI02-2A]